MYIVALGTYFAIHVELKLFDTSRVISVAALGKKGITLKQFTSFTGKYLKYCPFSSVFCHESQYSSIAVTFDDKDPCKNDNDGATEK